MGDPFSMLMNPHGPRPVAPTYREAYPALSLVSVRRAWRDKVRLGEWRNEQHDLVGRVDLLDWSDLALDINFEWFERGERRRARAVFDILQRPTLTERWVPDAMCPGCMRVTSTVYLVEGQWSCAGCHHLTTRAALLTAEEKRLLQVRRLHAEVTGRAPPVRGFRTWDAKRLQLRLLMEKFGEGDVAELREHLRAQVALTWINTPHEAAEDHALTGLGYRRPDQRPPVVSPWFGMR